VGLIGVFIALFVPLVSRRRKKLFFDVVCEAWLIEEEDEKGAGRSEEHSSEVRRVLFIIDLRNPLWGTFSWLGGLDISPDQYERRISFSFGDSARILEAGVVEENPPDIESEVYADHFPPDKLIMKPMLLNQGDSIRLRLVVENPDTEPYLSWRHFFFGKPGYHAVRAQGRILGVRKIQQKRTAR
jgi:hypothetical protein